MNNQVTEKSSNTNCTKNEIERLSNLPSITEQKHLKSCGWLNSKHFCLSYNVLSYVNYIENTNEEISLSITFESNKNADGGLPKEKIIEIFEKILEAGL